MSDEEASPPPAAPAEPERPVRVSTGRAAFVISQLYYYVAAAAGMVLLVIGLIGALKGIRVAAWPAQFQSHREGWTALLRGMAIAIPGAVVAGYHLQTARRRHHLPYAAAPWERSLYAHVVAIVALGFLLSGGVGALTAVARTAVPPCDVGFPYIRFGPAPILRPIPVPSGRLSARRFLRRPECASRSEAARGIVDGLIVVLVAGAVWHWHTREVRRITTP